MKTAFLAVLLAVPALAKPAKDPYKNDDERSLYSVGFMMGRNLAPFALSAAELKAVQAGITDSVNAKPPAVDTRLYGQRVNELLEKRMKVSADKEKAKSKAFVEAFSKEAGVKPIPGGGFIKISAEGKGANPTAEDTVKVHYAGSLIDGSEFDSSYKRGEPIEAALSGGLVQCWLKGIPMLKPGAKAKFVCPSEVAYGDQGRAPVIKGGATLIFELELVEIVKKK